MKLLIWCGMSRGGIADYAHAQASALFALGVEVELICPPAFTKERAVEYPVVPMLIEPHGVRPIQSRVYRGATLATALVLNAWRVARYARKSKPDAVLGHFAEYLAPLWAWQFRALKRAGIRFATVLHDPVRDHVVGPLWWHQSSVREALSFVDVAFVHEDILPVLPERIALVVLPHGTLGLKDSKLSRHAMRSELGIAQDSPTLISFGYLRDNKNLDLVLRAIARCPDYELIVAGAEQQGGNRPIAFYRALANELGCSERCHWLTRFLTADETASLFLASDLNLLTYSRSFLSASGVLATAAHYRRPSLASGGLRSLREKVAEYGIGIWVEPDSSDAIIEGLQVWRRGGLAPDWERYELDHSWQRNAELVRDAFANLPRESPVGGVSLGNLEGGSSG